MKPNDDELPEKEVAERRGEVIRRMLNTPPQPRVKKASSGTKAASNPKKARAKSKSDRR